MKSFLPWIIFFILSGRSPQLFTCALIIAIILTLLFDFQELKKAYLISWASLLYFVFLFIAVVIFNNQWINQHAWLFSNGVLAAIAWISIVIRKPFTLQYAKEKVASDKWQHPVFLRINYLISAAWGFIFLINASLHLLPSASSGLSSSIKEIISYLPTIFGIWFTAWFPDWYKKNLTH